MGGTKPVHRAPPYRRRIVEPVQRRNAAQITTDQIPHDFVEYMKTPSQVRLSTPEPPRKRQKVAPESDWNDFVVVKRSILFLVFSRPQLESLESPVLRSNTPIVVNINPNESGSYHVEILDTTSKDHHQLLDIDIEADDIPLREINLARNVSLEDLKPQNPKSQGRLWTEVDLEMGHESNCDYLRIHFAIKWNTTLSLEYISPRNNKRPALQSILTTYFPEKYHLHHIGKRWSPQAFYDSVYVPDKDDPKAMSLKAAQLDTELYPFQKRTIKWLLAREGAYWVDGRVQPLPVTDVSQLPHSFRAIKDVDGTDCFLSDLLQIVTKDPKPYKAIETSFRGGILAEEMGLGKTVEVIALISLHRRRLREPVPLLSPETSGDVKPSPATLIITPPSILLQWVSELNRHAPSLKVMHYQGINAHQELSEFQLLEEMNGVDVVLATYNVLASEIHYSLPPPDRQLRQEQKYPRRKSPLLQLSWWRVCLDEAQMIESGVSNAATVARLIPRINAWGITGTPVKRDIKDLLGLLIFLRFEPYASIGHLWNSLVVSHRDSFQSLFQQIALRHTKQLVRDELGLPPQQRFVITMPFTPIEEQYYQSLYQQMCEDCGVDSQGAPLADNWDPEDPLIVDRMRSWLVRLRQSALHPEVGGRNRRALGNKDGPLRTVDQVLEVMLDQSESSIRFDQRSLSLSKLKRGQLLENSPRVKEALEIWEEVLQNASAVVAECRAQLQREIETTDSGGKSSVDYELTEDSTDSDSHQGTGLASSEVSTRTGTFRNRLRGALEIEHMAVFFCANAHFQIKSFEGMTIPGSFEFKNLERLETEGYERAKKIRQEILKEIFQRNIRLMRKVAKRASSQSFVQIPEFLSTLSRGGIESRRIVDQFDTLGAALDAQANQLDAWREQTIQFLLRPLVDEDEGLEITGDEYEESTKTQDEVMVYVQALRAVIEDRHDALTGQENTLIKEEVKTALRLAKEGDGAFPQKVIELLGVRQELKPPAEMGSIKAIISDFRALSTTLRLDAERGSNRAQNELAIVEQHRQRVQREFNEQIKAVVALRQEIDTFTALMNSRLEYYRQLQQVSDMVAPFEGGHNPRLYLNLLAEEDKLVKKIATASSKRRYLLHLRNEAADPAQQRMCVICQSTFELGALTICGHQFCKDCISLWWSAHKNCPTCKRRLTQNDLHDITYKPQELKVAKEGMAIGPHQSSPGSTTRKSMIYSEISKSTLSQIKNIELNGPSFTTKVDTLARHLLYLREKDPGAKSVIFSQFKEFLEVLSRALTTFRIGFSTIDRRGGTEKFKQDAGTECFLLHARAHSSGLNLINASHVFLCEPLINTALELQAIARVDRIGQRQTTNVYLYIVDGTVEESIYDISVNRRLQHMGRSLKGKSKESTPELLDSSIEAANSLELQQAPLSNLLTKGGAGGEMVDQKDLWGCLFGNAKIRQVPNSVALDREIAGQLGAETAEIRQTGDVA